MTCEPLDQFDVVVVPFPFSDSPRSKRRPALVLSVSESLGASIGHSVMAMVTSATHSPWPLDVDIHDLKSAGLPAPSKVRMKLFTLDHQLVIRKAGHLATEDQELVRHSLRTMLAV